MNHFCPSGTLQARAFANAGLVPFPALLLFIPWGGNTAMPHPRQMLSKEGPKHSAHCIVRLVIALLYVYVMSMLCPQNS